VFSAVQQVRLQQRGVGAAHLSLSDDDDRVLAFVVLECAVTASQRLD
jgi:phosphopantetheinyl transferase (holo-ACP synthase)